MDEFRSSSGSPKVGENIQTSPKYPFAAESKDHPSRTKRSLCRNILLYGNCKYSESGCMFRHDNPLLPQSSTPEQSFSRKKLNAASASFQPKSSLSSKAANAAVFVPKTQEPPMFLSRDRTPLAISSTKNTINPYANPGILGADGMYSNDAYYSQQNQLKLTRFHLYNPQPSTLPTLRPYDRNVNDLFIEDNIREELERNTEASRQTLHALPSIVSNYTSLSPLNKKLYRYKEDLGFNVWTYQATCTTDKNTYVLRRLQDCPNLVDLNAVETLKRIFHPNIVTFYNGFNSDTFNDQSLILVYDYHPRCSTLKEMYFDGTSAVDKSQTERPMPDEKEQWNYMFQMAIAISHLHKNGLACNHLTPSRILINRDKRIRINSCADYELAVPIKPPLESRQQQDLKDFGCIIANLATGSLDDDMAKAARHINHSYSRDFYKAVLSFISDEPVKKNIDSFFKDYAVYFLSVMDASFKENAAMEKRLSQTIQHKRFFQILYKLMYITDCNDRPAVLPGFRDRKIYLLHLLRDYLFHQVDEGQCPLIDLCQVLTTLGKLDAGIGQSVALISRDELDCASVTYSELKAWIDDVFELEINL
ncbi:PAN complex protein phosphotransferase subunit Ppk26 [Schizosaccharomyces osmophilus]|uniref:PAN complex protein phosphotransferase subunit Ppk26 n=1 Tax=Schizosaccharomyces osmophilus TaxID=2545709 RepID=A0AAF0AU06_9SCHI|nr:PAN complex protein phosphotransferase subunit Ppk26 [Schizosaccharomyces osmophilus]WBW72001.1 PAN complex protein phosphotransferase subunit Ppk26 [Schizosaccharomyces osmophilus]